MLVVTRKVGEGLHIGDDIVVTVVQVSSGSIRLAIDAPRAAPIWRKELLDGSGRVSNPARPVRRDEFDQANGNSG